MFRYMTSKVLIHGIFCLILICLTVSAPQNVSSNEISDLERFFAECPTGTYYRLHQENEAWDLHDIFYQTTALGEIEVLRIADWIIDLPILGRPVQPFVRTFRIIRSEYNKMPQWIVTRRLGEFVDAWQIPELSIGGASATYSAATGGTTGLGGGVIIRVNKLIDWTQHITGDINQLLGWIVKSPLRIFKNKSTALADDSTNRPKYSNHLIPGSLLGDIVDGTQWMLIKTFNGLTIFTARTVEELIGVVEKAGEVIINYGYHPPHRDTTVFLRLPESVFSAHKHWFLKKRRKIIASTSNMISASTHAQLTRRNNQGDVIGWDDVPYLLEDQDLIVMMPSSVFSSAPESLEAYVVPASWVLEQSK